jgi:hypothetical protein
VSREDSSVAARPRLLLALAAGQAVLAVVTLVLSFAGSGPSERAVVLGLSWPRLGLTLVLVLALAGSIGTGVVAARAGPRAVAIVGHLRKRRSVYLGVAICMLLVGSAVVVVDLLGKGGAIAGHIRRMAPAAAWLAFSGVLIAGAMAALGTRPLREGLTLAALGGVLLVGEWAHVAVWPSAEPTSNDIYFTYLEGRSLLEGRNPYERILEDEGGENQKYPTYLPLFYYLGAGVQAIGFADFAEWIGVWRVVFLVASGATAAMVFRFGQASGYPLFGAFGALFWEFNRWSLHLVRTADMDFLPIALLVLAWLSLEARPRTALWILGASLAIKHYAVLAVPAAWMAARTSDGGMRGPAREGIRLAAIPVAVSLPLLVASPAGFLRSILFSVTRDPVAIGDVPSLDLLLGWEALAARVPMLALLVFVYAAQWRGWVRPMAAMLLVMSVVTFLNSVFFTSYMVWLIPWIPLVVVESLGAASRLYSQSGIDSPP